MKFLKKFIGRISNPRHSRAKWSDSEMQTRESIEQSSNESTLRGSPGRAIACPRMTQFLMSFFFILSFLTLSFLTLSSSLASGIAYSTIGEKFQASMNPPKGSEISWILTKDSEIIEKIDGKKFSQTFTSQGEYIVRIITTAEDKTTKSTILKIIVAEKLPNFAPLTAKIASIPAIKNNEITLQGVLGESENVIFSFGDSLGEIIKYEFDADIFSDSDGDFEINNDIDNLQTPSYFTGSSFSYSYKNTGIPARARLKVYSEENEVEEIFVNIKFSDTAENKSDREKKYLQAVLKTLPESNSDGNILLKKSGNQKDEKISLVVLGKYSEGKISAYHIDTDLSFDSDGDGNPENDIDNSKHVSLETGEMFSFDLPADAQEQNISLSVLAQDGKKSTVQKKIIVTNNFASNLSGQSSITPILFASRSQVTAGESITFRVFNIPENAKISWDFESDQTLEIEEGDTQKVEYKFAEAGKHSLTVNIIESGKIPLKLKKNIIVGEGSGGEVLTSPPNAFFESQVFGNQVQFVSSLSHADIRLSNTDISYAWDFGDGYKTQGPNPNHIYEKIGKYQVILTIEDSTERTAQFTQEIEITELEEEFIQDQHGGIITEENNPSNTPTPVPEEINSDEKNSENNKNNNKNNTGNLGENSEENTNNTENNSSETKSSDNSSTGFSIPWWVFLILFILMLPFLFVIKKKIDDPDKDFGKIIEELLVKKQKPVLDVTQKIDINAENQSSSDDIQQAEIVEENNTDDDSGDTPDWMRNYDDENSNDMSNADTIGDDENSNDEVTENTDITSESTQENFDQPALPETLELENSSDINTTIDETVDKTVENIPELEINDSVKPDWLKGADSPFDDDLSEESESLENSSVENTDIENTNDYPFDMEHPEWLEEIKTDEILEENPQENSTDEILEEEQVTEDKEAIESDEDSNEENTPDWLAEPLDKPLGQIEVSDESALSPDSAFISSDEEEISEELQDSVVPENSEEINISLAEDIIPKQEFEEISDSLAEGVVNPEIDNFVSFEDEDEKILAQDAKISDDSKKSKENLPEWLKGEEI